MIPRFNCAFPVREIFGSIAALWAKELPKAPVYARLFPGARVHEVGSARAGMAYALAALQLPRHARVGVQPYTCSSVLVAIREAGLTPVFVDIDLTLTLDTADLARKIKDLSALIVTHTFGIPANVERLKEVVGDLPVIEDCAHAFGSRYNGVQLGNFFDMAVFSFGNGKFPAFGSGGLLVVNNRQYRTAVGERVSRLKPNTRLRELYGVGRQLVWSLLQSRWGYAVVYQFLLARWSDRGTGLDTRLGPDLKMAKVVQWRLRAHPEKLQAAAVRQRRNAQTLIDRHRARFQFVSNPDPDSSCFALICLHPCRDELFNHLVRSGIGAGKHFQHAPRWAAAFGYQRGTCPTFDRLTEQIVTIPCHDAITPDELSIIDEALARWSQGE